jgi:hypothetical protein
MIELRWLKSSNRRCDQSIKQIPAASLPPVYFTLQYRDGEYPYEAPHAGDWRGSAWKDVPIVEQD